jgi:hypothetical protein
MDVTALRTLVISGCKGKSLEASHEIFEVGFYQHGRFVNSRIG